MSNLQAKESVIVSHQLDIAQTDMDSISYSQFSTDLKEYIRLQ